MSGLLTIYRPALATGNNPVNPMRSRNLLSECRDVVVAQHSRVQRIDTFLGCTLMKHKHQSARVQIKSETFFL